MRRQVMRLKEAQPILKVYHQEILDVINSGFTDWLKLREFSNSLEGGPVNYKPRTKGGVIHDHIEKHVRNNFSNREGVEVGDYKGVFGMVLQDSLFVRFKKMDSSYSVRNLYTRQHAKYMNQSQIDGFPTQPTFLFAGYMPDKTWSSIKGIYIACWIGDMLEWVDEFGIYTAEQAVLDFEQAEHKAIENIETRIKLRKEKRNGGRTGTDN